MDKQYSLNQDNSFSIDNYNQTMPFSNFLPGIAGIWGIPVWVFYVNRGQGVVSFGLNDKDNSIAEFLPANKAYTFAPTTGFRTFLKIDSMNCYEPFQINHASAVKQNMSIRSASLCLQENNSEIGLSITVKYWTLPNTIAGGLVRMVTIKNISQRGKKVEVIDGLSRVIPFGLNDWLVKHLSRTMEAWMRSPVENNMAIFRLIVDPADTAETKFIEGAAFNYAFCQDSNKKIFPRYIVDPQVLFGYDTSLSRPINFFDCELDLRQDMISVCKTPCAFSYFDWTLRPGEEKTIYSVFGASEQTDLIKKFTIKIDAEFLSAKERENERIIENIKANALTVSSSPEFDQYVGCSYLDNVLRGGLPYAFGENDFYYVYSRKHGDLERDYNRFRLLPSNFSEGEANYRDINQNRRMDLFFAPGLGGKNLKLFLNYIKIDGYNPLTAQGEKLILNEKDAVTILKKYKIFTPAVLTLAIKGFYLGEFFKLLQNENIKAVRKDDLAGELVIKARREPTAAFGEGYWIDHWEYTLDLLENYLYFYPDDLKNLFLTDDYFYWDDEHTVKERKRRYHLRDGVVYQWHSLQERNHEKKALIEQRSEFKNFLRDKNDKIYRTNLIEKLLSLILNKSATLDPYGLGVEMEAGKPGWCDSLNGLPAMFGSSVCETYEIKRACLMLEAAIVKLQERGIQKITVCEEIYHFFNRLNNLLIKYEIFDIKNRDYFWWDKANEIKEEFRKETFMRITGEKFTLSSDEVIRFLRNLIVKLSRGIVKTEDKISGVRGTYFMYKVSKYHQDGKTIIPLEFEQIPLALFLEGPVHALRLERTKSIYTTVKKSSLFDKHLKMYRLNASLKTAPLEIGRSRVFVPGWLENESIWLHMEYKYLLEVLKSGLYKEFFQDFSQAAVCYFDPKTYGRNTMENSSFIVSSAYSDKNLWGKGFVARLSGATVELLNIWVQMCLGHQPFLLDEHGRLIMRFAPILAGLMFLTQAKTIVVNNKEIIVPAGCFAFLLFSRTFVVYHNAVRKDTFGPTGVSAVRIEIVIGDKIHSIAGQQVPAPISEIIRQGKASRIDVYFE